ncbi:MAG: hypothetical protein D3924_04570 [Candidatus Electrothrix sp. AR4]|nr:hypothetical protein [Candidatus Electrothrix sp. AR4]
MGLNGECSLFPISYHSNISRSLRKEPKYYLWDWAMVADQGGRYENMVAGHLLKAVHLWPNLGPGKFELFFLRTRDSKPWFLVEVKSSDTKLSRHLAYFQEKTGADHAFQVTVDAPFVDADCFAVPDPVKVPAKTFLSQLI